MHELNELLALIFVAITCVATVAVYRHPANTAHTREWWGRFLRLLGLLMIAQIATNVEQLFPTSGLGDAFNALEHLALVGAATWAVTISLRGLGESYARRSRDGRDHEPEIGGVADS